LKYRTIIRSRADCDEEEIFDFLARRSLATAHRFLDSLHETLRTISDRTSPGMPCAFENPKLAGLRWSKVNGFPNHLIFFRLDEDRLEVLRVLHDARDLETLLSS